MDDSQQAAAVHGLRAEGLGPNQIARRLGVRPTEETTDQRRSLVETPAP